jgi:hypothetical protein
MSEVSAERVILELDRPREFRFDLHALSDLQKKAGLKLDGLEAWLAGINDDLDRLILVLWAGLRQEDKEMTFELAGRLITPKNMGPVMNQVMAHLGYAMGSVEKNGAGATAKKKAKSGTGPLPLIPRAK